MTVGSRSSLERIGDYCFGGLRFGGFKTPPSVRHIGSIFSVGLDQIFVKTTTGRLLTLECDLTDKIEVLRAKLQEMGYPSHCYHLVCAGGRLEDGRTLLDYGVEPGSTVHMGLITRPC